MIEEDSDVVFEGHPLHQYLLDQGLDDFEVVSTKTTDYTKSTSLGQTLMKCKDCVYDCLFDKPPSVQEPYFALMINLERIFLSDLLVEEDNEYVKIATTLQEVVLPSPFWRRKKNLVFTLGTCTSFIAWLQGYAHWSVPVVTSCVTTECLLSDWLSARQRSKLSADLEKLLINCKALLQTLRKALKYIQENETLFRGHTLAHTARSDLDIAGYNQSAWFLMNRLRTSVCVSVEDAIENMQKGTMMLLEQFPLNGEYNKKEYYRSIMPMEKLGLFDCSDEEKQSLKHLKKIQEVYTCLQSELLKRISLSLIATLWKNEDQTLGPLFTVINSISTRFSILLESLLLDLKFHSSYGLDKPEEKWKPMNLNQKCWGAHLGVHSARLHLQGLLHRIWKVERYLQEEDDQKITMFANSIVCELNDIMSECKLFTNSVEHSVCQLLALNNPTVNDKSPASLQPKKTVDSEPIPVGYTDLDPPTVDEVFEAIARDDDTKHETYEEDSIEERKKMMMEKQCSDRVMSELKSVLIHKAKEMKRREAQAIRKRSSVGETGINYNDSEEETSFYSLEGFALQSDSLISEDFATTSGIQTLSGTQNTTPQETSELTDDDLKPFSSGLPMRGLPTKEEAKDLLGNEDTFGDSGDSDDES